MYFLNSANLLELYVETQLSDNYDDRKVERIASDELVFGTALYLTLF